MKFYLSIGAVAVVVIIGLFTIFGSFYTVDPGDEAVVLAFGNPVASEGPGFHLKTPFVNDVRYISMQSHYQDFDEETYSKDQQPAQIKFSVNFHVAPGGAQQVVTEYTTFDKLNERVLRQKGSAVFKNVFGTVDAQTAIQNRAKLNADFLAALQASIEGSPMVIESVQIKDIKFSPDYEAAIATKQQATVKVQEQQQLLAQEQVKAQIVATTAKGQSDAAIAQATGAAEAVKLNADAEAHAIQVKGDAQAAVIAQRGRALKDNPGVVALIQAEKWDGKLPVSMPPNSAVPFLSLPVPQPQP
jgi:regulator of protease activity HflC (stomatin/prohibitin superfamily)